MSLFYILLYLLPLMGSAPSSGKDVCQLYGSVKVTKNILLADYTVYLSKEQLFADLCVYSTSSHIFADKTGVWHFTEQPGEADFTVFFTNNKVAADFSISYVSNNIFAGCR